MPESIEWISGPRAAKKSGVAGDIEWLDAEELNKPLTPKLEQPSAPGIGKLLGTEVKKRLVEMLPTGKLPSEEELSAIDLKKGKIDPFALYGEKVLDPLASRGPQAMAPFAGGFMGLPIPKTEEQIPPTEEGAYGKNMAQYAGALSHPAEGAQTPGRAFAGGVAGAALTLATDPTMYLPFGLAPKLAQRLISADIIIKTMGGNAQLAELAQRKGWDLKDPSTWKVDNEFARALGPAVVQNIFAGMAGRHALKGEPAKETWTQAPRKATPGGARPAGPVIDLKPTPDGTWEAPGVEPRQLTTPPRQLPPPAEVGAPKVTMLTPEEAAKPVGEGKPPAAAGEWQNIPLEGLEMAPPPVARSQREVNLVEQAKVKIASGELKPEQVPGWILEQTGRKKPGKRSERLREQIAQLESHIEIVKRRPDAKADGGKRLKGMGMRLSAMKREESGKLTAKEQAKKDLRDARLNPGDAVQVDGKRGVIKSLPFGRVTIQFEDGTKKVVDRSGVMKETPPEDLGAPDLMQRKISPPAEESWTPESWKALVPYIDKGVVEALNIPGIKTPADLVKWETEASPRHKPGITVRVGDEVSKRFGKDSRDVPFDMIRKQKDVRDIINVPGVGKVYLDDRAQREPELARRIFNSHGMTRFIQGVNKILGGLQEHIGTVIPSGRAEPALSRVVAIQNGFGPLMMNMSTQGNYRGGIGINIARLFEQMRLHTPEATGEAFLDRFVNLMAHELVHAVNATQHGGPAPETRHRYYTDAVVKNVISKFKQSPEYAAMSSPRQLENLEKFVKQVGELGRKFGPVVSKTQGPVPAEPGGEFGMAIRGAPDDVGFYSKVETALTKMKPGRMLTRQQLENVLKKAGVGDEEIRLTLGRVEDTGREIKLPVSSWLEHVKREKPGGLGSELLTETHKVSEFQEQYSPVRREMIDLQTRRVQLSDNPPLKRFGRGVRQVETVDVPKELQEKFIKHNRFQYEALAASVPASIANGVINDLNYQIDLSEIVRPKDTLVSGSVAHNMFGMEGSPRKDYEALAEKIIEANYGKDWYEKYLPWATELEAVNRRLNELNITRVAQEPMFEDYTQTGPRDRYETSMLGVKGKVPPVKAHDLGQNPEGAFAWNRATHRTDSKGRKVFLIEEVQSDLAQKDTIQAALARPAAIGRNNVMQGVRNFPYISKTGDWVELILKKAIINAAKSGAELVALTPPEEQILRWQGENVSREASGELSLKLNERGKGLMEFYSKYPPGTLSKMASQLGARLVLTDAGAQNPTTQYKLYHKVELPEEVGGEMLPENLLAMELTPKIRERILKEGLPTFGAIEPAEKFLSEMPNMPKFRKGEEGAISKELLMAPFLAPYWAAKGMYKVGAKVLPPIGEALFLAERNLFRTYQAFLASRLSTAARNTAQMVGAYGLTGTMSDALIAGITLPARFLKPRSDIAQINKDALSTLKGRVIVTRQLPLILLSQLDLYRGGKGSAQTQALKRLSEIMPKELSERFWHFFGNEVQMPNGATRPLTALEKANKLVMFYNLMADGVGREAIARVELQPLLDKYGLESVMELEQVAMNSSPVLEDTAKGMVEATTMGLAMTGGLGPTKSENALMRRLGVDAQGVTKVISNLPIIHFAFPFSNYMLNNFLPGIMMFSPFSIANKRIQNSMHFMNLYPQWKAAQARVAHEENVFVQMRYAGVGGPALKAQSNAVRGAKARAKVYEKKLNSIDAQGRFNGKQILSMAMYGSLIAMAFYLSRLERGEDKTEFDEYRYKNAAGEEMTWGAASILGPANAYAYLGDRMARITMGSNYGMPKESEATTTAEKLLTVNPATVIEKFLSTKFGKHNLATLFGVITDDMSEEKKKDIVARVSADLGRQFGALGPIGEPVIEGGKVLEPGKVERTGSLVQEGDEDWGIFNPSAFGRGARSQYPKISEDLPVRYDVTTGEPMKSQTVGRKFSPVQQFLQENQRRVKPAEVLPRMTSSPTYNDAFFTHYRELLATYPINRSGQSVLEAIGDEEMPSEVKTEVVKAGLQKIRQLAHNATKNQILEGEKITLPPDISKSLEEGAEKGEMKEAYPEHFPGRPRRLPKGLRLTPRQLRMLQRQQQEQKQP